MIQRAIVLLLSLAATVVCGAQASSAGTPAVPSAAQSISPEALARDPRVMQALRLLEAWADAETAEKRLPAVSMAVVHDQQLLWSRGFGYAHLEQKVAARADTMYSICSISKLFTGIAVMQQRDAGTLGLDDPVAKHLRPRDMPIVMITSDAEGLKQKLVSDAASTITYEAEKPQDLLDEDKFIGAMRLGIRAEAVRVIPVDDVFRR